MLGLKMEILMGRERQVGKRGPFKGHVPCKHKSDDLVELSAELRRHQCAQGSILVLSLVPCDYLKNCHHCECIHLFHVVLEPPDFSFHFHFSWISTKPLFFEMQTVEIELRCPLGHLAL